MKKVLSLTLVLTLLLGVFALTPAAAEGSKLIYALSSDPQTMDPTINSYSIAATVLKQLFVGLYKVGPDGSSMLPALAERVTTSEDGATYTFTLKKDLKWSDGSPLTATDFENTWKHTLDPDRASKAAKDLFGIKNAKAYFEKVEGIKWEDVGIKATDAQTLVVELVSPTPWFITLLGGTAFVPVHQSMIDGLAKENPWDGQEDWYVCNGPFMLTDYEIKVGLKLVKNPNYVDADAVKLEALDFAIIPDAASELVAYENGEVDVADNLGAEAISRFTATPDYHLTHRVGLTYLDFNCEKAPFDNKLVRQAFSMSMDRALIIEKIMKSADQPMYAFVPARQPSVTDPSKSYRDVVGDTFAYDVEKAKALLAEAGYADMSTFPEVELVVSASQTNKDFAQGLQAMWKQNLGANIKITTYESGVFWDELDAGNFMIDRNGFTLNYADPYAGIELFRTGFNAYENRWDNAEYDAMVDAARAEADPAKREALILAAETFLTEEMPVVPFCGISDDFLAKPHVQGIVKNIQGHVLFEYVTLAQ